MKANFYSLNSFFIGSDQTQKSWCKYQRHVGEVFFKNFMFGLECRCQSNIMTVYVDYNPSEKIYLIETNDPVLPMLDQLRFYIYDV